MSPKIPIFGVFDLIEILQTLRNKPNAKLEETRPMKVIAFLKSEVKRMIRQMTPHPDQTIVQALMDFVKEEKVDTCIHSQSLFIFYSKIKIRVEFVKQCKTSFNLTNFSEKVKKILMEVENLRINFADSSMKKCPCF